MESHWQYSTVHNNNACKVIEEKTLWGRDGVPCLVAEPGRGGARAPLRLAAAKCRLAAGNRGWRIACAAKNRQGDRGTCTVYWG
jgi:hypothetical protein